MNFEEAEAYLYSLKHHGAKYGIDRMRVLMERIGHPEKKFPVIHVAGTNGKGSVCAMLESIYRKAGYKTGLFTSPHLVYVGERIKVNGESISKEELIGYVERLRPIADAIGGVDSDDHPSFFEFINAIGFQYFMDKGVEIGIVETGLGGEKDSTNVVDPLVSVITSVSWDHAEILGERIEDIAEAKAGIIKQGKPLVVGKLGEAPRAVIEQAARERGVEIFDIGERFELRYPSTGLKGSYQRQNAAVAQLTCEVARSVFDISDEIIKEGLEEVKWEGRFQEIKLPEGRTVILDIAHNEEGAQALAENLEEGSKLVVVLGATSEARGKALIERLCGYAKKFVLVKARHPRAVSGEELLGYLPEGMKKNCMLLNMKDLRIEGVSDPGDRVLVTGSIYLVGEVLKSLNGKGL